jgi:hypothetical protein
VGCGGDGVVMRWEEAVDGFCAVHLACGTEGGDLTGAVNEAAVVASAVAGAYLAGLLDHVI